MTEAGEDQEVEVGVLQSPIDAEILSVNGQKLAFQQRRLTLLDGPQGEQSRDWGLLAMGAPVPGCERVLPPGSVS